MIEITLKTCRLRFLLAFVALFNCASSEVFAAAGDVTEPKTPGSRSQLELPTKDEIQRRFGSDSLKPINPISPTKPIVLGEPPAEVSPALREQVITLQGAVEQSAKTNQSISKDRYEVARFKWDYRAAQVSRLPNLRVLSYLAQQTVGGNLAVPSKADGFIFLSAMMPVTQQYRLGLEVRAVKLASEIAEYKLEQEIDDTKAKVKATYYTLVLDQSKISTLETSIKYLEELKITTANRVKEGNSLKVDAMKVGAKLEKQQLEILKARNSYDIDCQKFNHLMGRNISQGFSLQELPPPSEVELNIQLAEQKALQQRPELRAADARRRQINLEKKIRIAEYIPNVSIGAVFVSLPGFNNEVLPKYVLAPGMFINYNAFDWGRRAFNAKAQGKSEQAATANLLGIKDEVLIDLHTQINKITEARLAIKASKYARDVALEDLRVSMNRYKFTSDKLAEVLEALSTLAEANNGYEQAMLAFWNAKAEFDRAIGE